MLISLGLFNNENEEYIDTQNIKININIDLNIEYFNTNFDNYKLNNTDI